MAQTPPTANGSTKADTNKPRHEIATVPPQEPLANELGNQDMRVVPPRG